MMAEFFESGRVVDLILALIVVEAAILCGLALVWRDRVPVTGWLFNLAAGACLLLALRAVLSDAAWPVAGVWLVAALIAHVGDLIQRLRRSASKQVRES